MACLHCRLFTRSTCSNEAGQHERFAAWNRALQCIAVKAIPVLWRRYITEADLEFFKERTEREGEVKGAGPWEHMVTKDFGSFTYEAWRRWLSVRRASWNLLCAGMPATLCSTAQSLRCSP